MQPRALLMMEGCADHDGAPHWLLPRDEGAPNWWVHDVGSSLDSVPAVCCPMSEDLQHALRQLRGDASLAALWGPNSESQHFVTPPTWRQKRQRQPYSDTILPGWRIDVPGGGCQRDGVGPLVMRVFRLALGHVPGGKLWCGELGMFIGADDVVLGANHVRPELKDYGHIWVGRVQGQERVKPHTDASALTLNVVLQGAKKGGELRLGKDSNVTLPPNVTLTVFCGDLWHQGTRVLDGTRYVLTAAFYLPDQRIPMPQHCARRE